MIWQDPKLPRDPFKRDEPHKSPEELAAHRRRLDAQWCEHGRYLTLCPECSDLA